MAKGETTGRRRRGEQQLKGYSSADESSKDISQYLHDLTTVRDILAQHDERPLLEHWAFYTWGILVFLGTLLHALLARTGAELGGSTTLIVWLPVVIVGAAFETASWIRKIKDDDLPVFGRRFMRFMLNFVSIAAAFFAVVLTGYAHGSLSPGILLALAALFFTGYAQSSFIGLFYEGYVTLIAGIVLLALEWNGFGAYVFAGILTSAVFIATGIHSELLGRGNRE